MRVRNRNGDPVDPVPFLVSTGLSVMLLFSTGPLYGLAYGLSVRVSLVLSSAGAVAVAAFAYHRLVWVATPSWVQVPAELRFQRLLYVALAFGVILLGLSVPLL
ncbi:hypothetical protein [Natronomonas marina]|jgi:hypothetical protein|uniref:hypothetical protein n=1 Tax=Natronomonas marina TaxID=2961939 RepID=UPI0020C98A34|nr:hypothetical protein [Natronomonas marina]